MSLGSSRWRLVRLLLAESLLLAVMGGVLGLDDSALLRWNDCARVLNDDPSIGRAAEHPEPRMHD